MNNLVEVRIPNLGPNDEKAFITEWFVKNGDNVNLGDPILNIETTKSNIDIEAEGSGSICILEGNQDVEVGQVVAIITNNVLDKEKYLASVKKEFNVTSNYQLSKKAIKFIEENSIDLRELNLLPNKIYTEKDIKQIIEKMDGRIEEESIYYSKNSQEIVVFGGGGHAKMCIETLKQIHQYKIIGIVDDVLKKDDEVLGIPVLGNSSILPKLISEGINKIVLGIGAVDKNPFIREEIYFKLKEMGFELPNLIHPKATIDASVILGEGNQIFANAVIGSNVKLGNNNIVNSGAIVSHDCLIKNSTHITPGAILAGSIKVNNNAVIGMGSTIYLKLEIGKNAIIHNNCRVTRNVADFEIVKSDI